MHGFRLKWPYTSSCVWCAAVQAVALLVGYDVDSNATWGNPAAVLGAGRRSSSSGSGSGGGSSKGRGGPQAPGLAGAGEAGATLYDAMDVSMEYDIDLVAVPLQVRHDTSHGSRRVAACPFALPFAPCDALTLVYQLASCSLRRLLLQMRSTVLPLGVVHCTMLPSLCGCALPAGKVPIPQGTPLPITSYVCDAY